MAVTLVASYKVSTGDSGNGNTLTTPSFTPAVGEILVVKAGTETFDSPRIGSLSSSAGLSFTQRDDYSAASKAPARISTTTVTSAVAQTVSCTFTVDTGRHFLVVERWAGAVLDATPALISAKTGGPGNAPSTTLTTEAPNSVVTWVCVDWSANTGTPAYRSGASEVAKEQYNAYAWYAAYQSCGAAGSQTVGMSAPTQNWTLLGVELQDASASGVGTRQNLSPNPACKVNATGWTGPSGWARSASVDASLPRATGFEGTTSGDVKTPLAGVVAGRSYYWAVSVNALSAQAAALVVDYYTATSGGSFVGNSGTTVPLSLASGTSGRFIAGPYTVPAGAAAGQLRLNGLAAAEVTAVQVEVASTFATYFDGDSPGAAWDGTAGNSTSTVRQVLEYVTVAESFTVASTAVGPTFHDGLTVGASFTATASSPASGVSTAATVLDGFLISSLEWDEDRGRNRVSAFTFGPSVVQARVSRRPVRGGPWELVRGGAIDVAGGRMVRPADDYEFPSGTDLDYRIEGVTAAGVVVQSATVRRQSVADSVWLKFITQPALNQRLTFMGRTEVSRSSRTAVYDVRGRPDPVVVSDVHSSRRMTIRCKAETPDEAATLDHALSQGLPCYLQVPETINTPSMYAVIMDYQSEAPALKSMRSIFTIPLVEVAAPPATIVSPQATWQQVLDDYATWEVLMAAAPTWLDTAD